MNASDLRSDVNTNGNPNFRHCCSQCQCSHRWMSLKVEINAKNGISKELKKIRAHNKFRVGKNLPKMQRTFGGAITSGFNGSCMGDCGDGGGGGNGNAVVNP